MRSFILMIYADLVVNHFVMTDYIEYLYSLKSFE